MPKKAMDAALRKFGDGSIFIVYAFDIPKTSWVAVAAIIPIAIAVIPEYMKHMYQLEIYVRDVVKRKAKLNTA